MVICFSSDAEWPVRAGKISLRVLECMSRECLLARDLIRPVQMHDVGNFLGFLISCSLPAGLVRI